MVIDYYIRLMGLNHRKVARELGITPEKLREIRKGWPCPGDVQQRIVEWGRGCIMHRDFDTDDKGLAYRIGSYTFPMFDEGEDTTVVRVSRKRRREIQKAMKDNPRGTIIR